MSLKVIAGVHGGRVLRTVRGLGTRPLLGQVKAAIFNILAEQVPGALVWDLFAGTGSNGIEALSRGARRVVCVEQNDRARDVLRGNLRMLGEDASAASVVVRADAWEPPVVPAGRLGGTGSSEPGSDWAAGDAPDAAAGVDAAAACTDAGETDREAADPGPAM